MSAEDWEDLVSEEEPVAPESPPAFQVSDAFLLTVSQLRIQLRKTQFAQETLTASLPAKKRWKEEKIRAENERKLERRVANLNKKSSRNEKQSIATRVAEMKESNIKNINDDINKCNISITKKHNADLEGLVAQEGKIKEELRKLRDQCAGHDPEVKEKVDAIVHEYDRLINVFSFRVGHKPGALAHVSNDLIESLFCPEFQSTSLQKVLVKEESPKVETTNQHPQILAQLLHLGEYWDEKKYFLNRFSWHSGKSVVDDEVEPSWPGFSAWMEKHAASLNLISLGQATVDFSQTLFVKLKVFREQLALEKGQKTNSAQKSGRPPLTTKPPKDYEKDLQGALCHLPQPLPPLRSLLPVQNSLGFDTKVANARRMVFNILKDKDYSPGEKKRLILLTLFTIVSWISQELNSNFSMDLVVSLFRLAHDIYANFPQGLEPHQLGYLALTLEALGFPGQINGRKSSPEIDKAGWKVLAPIGGKVAASQTISKPIPQTFELEYCGPVMLKDLNPRYLSHADIRFSPDGWQYDLIKLIDNDQSVLVVVPTSAGKTFSSFYAISRMLEKVSKEKAPTKPHPECVLTARVVFVAPTLPLANQMSADIYHRYGKDRRCGIMTSEFKQNLKNCEIMIVTPDAFQTLLLSPANEQWAKDLLYVIFDEIHCIAEQNLDNNISPLVYTQVLSLVQCPFLALSATVRNPDDFRSWLAKLHHPRKVHLIPGEGQQVHRWTDLKKFYFLPDHEKTWVANTPLKDCLHHVHPFVFFNNSPLDTLDTVSLSPSECLQLFVTLEKVLPDPSIIVHLNPSKFFPTMPLKRIECFKYQEQLIAVFKALSEEHRLAVCEELRKTVPPYVERSSGTFADNALQLFFTLKKKNMLPAICFLFHQDLCEQTVAAMVKQLEDAEPQMASTSGKEEKEDKGKEKKKDEPEQVEERRDLWKELHQFQKMQIKAQIDAVKDYKNSVQPPFTLTTEDPFDSDMEWWLRRLLKKTSWKTTHPLIKGLMRGIGAYHSHLPKPYRDLVETLFRSSKLKVVISTTLLSLGVNMPCKSVVFLEDANFLTSVGYKQMAGRAGRRGFDEIGYTIFCDLAPPKIEQLIFSPLQQLESTVPIDIDTVLKMLILYHESTDKAGMISLLSRLMILPLNQQGDPVQISYFQLFIRSCIEFFYRAKLINDTGAPIGLAGVVSNTSAVTPANFALAYLIANGEVFKTICQPYEASRNSSPKERFECRQQLLHVLSFIIYTIPIHPTRSGGDCNAMPQIPPVVKQEYQAYNNEVTALFENAFNVFAGLGYNLPPESRFIPTIVIAQESSLNNYINDFFRHKKNRVLIAENQLSDFDAFQMLKKWSYFLKSLAKGLTTLVDSVESDPLCLAFQELSIEFEYDFEHIEVATV